MSVPAETVRPNAFGYAIADPHCAIHGYEFVGLQSRYYLHVHKGGLEAKMSSLNVHLHREKGHNTLISESNSNAGFVARPLPISVIGWWLIANGALAIIGLSVAFSPSFQAAWALLGVSPLVAIIFTFISAAAYSGAGYGILMGYAWGRNLYFAVGVVSLAFSVYITPDITLVLFGVVVYLVIVLVLTGRTATNYFNGTHDLAPTDFERKRLLTSIRASQRNRSDVSQVFGVLFSIGGGFFLALSCLIAGFAAPGLTVFMAAFFAIPGLFAIGIGILLWGRRRWAALSGWTLVAVGAWTVLTGVCMLVVIQTPYWLAAMAEAGDGVEVRPSVFVATTFIGVVVGIAGISLIYLQRNKDSEAVEQRMELEGTQEPISMS